jgi:hypothetical protein
MTPRTRHPWLLLAIAIASAEMIGLVVYGVAIELAFLRTGSSGTSDEDVAPWALLVIYFVFAALIGLIVRALWQGKASARTSYLVAQAFALVIAQSLISGSEGFEVALGWVMIVAAITGAIAIFTPAASQGLNRDR